MCKLICNNNIWYERSTKGAFDTLIFLREQSGQIRFSSLNPSIMRDLDDLLRHLRCVRAYAVC